MLKNIQQTIQLPSSPMFKGDIEAYIKENESWASDMQRVLEDYARTLADNIMEQPRLEDFRVPFTRDKQGQTSLPDFDFTNLGLLFPKNDDSEIVYLINQFPHGWKIGTPIHPHIHYIQDEATIPTFKMDYKLYNNGDTVPATWTTIATTGTGQFNYVSGSMLQILSFPDIDCSSITGVSAFLDVKFYRDDNVVSGDVLVKEWDFHYLRDSVGSREEYKK